MNELKEYKPIPKYILNKIQKIDLKEYPYQDGKTRFYAYLTKYGKELLLYYVAVKNKYKKWYCKQVVIHALHSDKCFVKDIKYTMIAGYTVGWYSEGLSKQERWFENKDWGWSDDKYFNLYATIVNPEFMDRFPQFKYSQATKFGSHDILKYLRLYERYPIAEMLMKLDFQRYAMSKMLLAKLDKDKGFRKWLFKHKEDIPRNAYVQSIISAYNKNEDVEKMQSIIEVNKAFANADNIRSIKDIIAKDEKAKFLNYIVEQATNISSYGDYIDACRYLGLNLNLPKNKYPHNFKYWHDMRIDQMHSKEAELNEKRRKQLYKDFAKIAKKYTILEQSKNKMFICVIAKSPQDLINEGEKLHHCVGRMNYDQKFAREESLIFFIRTKDNPETPFVTLEYSLKSNKVLQCYGEHDSTPSDKVMNYVNRSWLPYANKQIKALAI